MDTVQMLLLVIALIAFVMSAMSLLKVHLLDNPGDFLAHLTPDAILDARTKMKEELREHLEELVNQSHTDLKREMQALVYKEVADFRKWLSGQMPPE